MSKPRQWFVVRHRIPGEDRAIAAFLDESDALLMFQAGTPYAITEQPVYIGGSNPNREAILERLLRDIVTNDTSHSGDAKLFKAIDEAKRLLNIQ